MCFIGNMELHEEEPGLILRRVGSLVFSRVAADTLDIFSRYSGDGHLKLGFDQRSQDSCLVMTDTSGI